MAGLDKYRSKRRFSATPEPQGGAARGDPQFVVQKHSARRLHYDLRLEMSGALKSWAVPEGPCLDPKVRRFAKLVEDHPLDYGSFEGRIPDGNYGAGTVIVWDRGPWVTLDDPEDALAAGEIKFRLAGEKLKGGWMLKRLPDDPTNWLLIKERDIAARPLAEYDVLKEEPNSVITDRPVADRMSPSRAKTAPAPKAKSIPGAAAAPTPTQWSPQLATPAQAVPAESGWVHEIKYDGYRTLVFFENGRVRLSTRNGLDWTDRYGALAKAFEKLPCKSALLDGEVVVQDARGVSALDLLERALADRNTHAMTYFAFDLVYLDGYDLTAAKLTDRKRALAGLLDPLIDTRSPLQLSEHVEGDGAALFAQASRLGLEGVVSKRADSRYVQRRAPTWLKTKRVDIGKFIIVGFTTGVTKGAAALMLAEEVDGELIYRGRCGSGWGEAKAVDLMHTLQTAERATPVTPVPRTANAHWIQPDWIAEIGYRGRTDSGAPRAAVLLDVSARPMARAVTGLKPKLVADRDLAAIHLTNPDREMFKGSGVSKLDVALYYARVGDWMLPELLRRPVSLIRCTTGDIMDCFYQRHAFAGLPPGIEKVELKAEDGRAAFLTVTEPRGFLALAQFGAVEFHPWGCRIDDAEHPDRLVLDLDPAPDVPWSRVCDAAEMLRDRLAALGLTPFLRTTGGKGLHLVAALTPTHSWPMLKEFAAAIARAAAADAPAMFTAVASKAKRTGRVYIDYLRNGRGASAVASYSLRARPDFPAAAPIAWRELRNLDGGGAFTRKNMANRLEALAADPWDGLQSSAATITPQMRRELGMKN